MKRGPPLGDGPLVKKVNITAILSSHGRLSTSSGDSADAAAAARLLERAQALAEDVIAGKISFLDAVDSAYRYGVALALSDDASQEVLAAAFARVRRAP
jgi:hypothetical protein